MDLEVTVSSPTSYNVKRSTFCGKTCSALTDLHVTALAFDHTHTHTHTHTDVCFSVAKDYSTTFALNLTFIKKFCCWI